MDDKHTTWDEMAKRLWEEQAKEQLAEIQEELPDNSRLEFQHEIRRIEKRLDRNQSQPGLASTPKQVSKSISDQIANQLTAIQYGVCAECGQLITNSPDCIVCQAIYKAIESVYSRAEIPNVW